MLAAFGQRNVQHVSRKLCVFEEELVKVSHPEKQHCIRVSGFDFEVLRHERRYGVGHDLTSHEKIRASSQKI